MKKYRPFKNTQVAELFKNYPKEIQQCLFVIRQLILDLADSNKQVGAIEETIKWGEPSYITSKANYGSTIRLSWKKINPEQYAVYFNCKTTLVDTFKEIYSAIFKYEGSRGIIFNAHDKIPVDALSDCITMALTYKSNKRNICKKK